MWDVVHIQYFFFFFSEKDLLIKQHIQYKEVRRMDKPKHYKKKNKKEDEVSEKIYSLRFVLNQEFCCCL